VVLGERRFEPLEQAIAVSRDGVVLSPLGEGPLVPVERIESDVRFAVLSFPDEREELGQLGIALPGESDGVVGPSREPVRVDESSLGERKLGVEAQGLLELSDGFVVPPGLVEDHSQRTVIER
jgi:hypothetical protein